MALHAGPMKRADPECFHALKRRTLLVSSNVDRIQFRSEGSHTRHDKFKSCSTL